MFRAVMMTHWKWSRWGVYLLVAALFSTPVVLLGVLGTRDLTLIPVWEVLGPTSGAGAAYLVFSLFTGLWLAASAWNVDTAQDAVYALTRPVPRWYFVLMRLGSGVALSLVPILAVLAGALFAALVTTRPPEMRVFPVALTAKFAVATWLAYGFCFGGFTGFRPRTAARNVRPLVVILSGVLIDAATGSHVTTVIGNWLTGPWSPIGVFFGRWNLFDV
ncbi:MAG: hypothetical protein HYX65_01335 [Gemmatimonadetes bacterium]|nr:hypothetical protein [Gemmatimonadota bacterium]